MNRLNELAGLIDRGALAHGDRIELAAILRSAAKADAGMTEWHLVVGDARTSRHNAEVNAARARIAAVEAERDAALASLSAKQRAIDETLRWLESVKNDDMAYMVNLLRPHATPAASPVGNAASPQVSPVGGDDTRELIARLAEHIIKNTEGDYHGSEFVADLESIIAAARKETKQ